MTRMIVTNGPEGDAVVREWNMERLASGGAAHVPVPWTGGDGVQQPLRPRALKSVGMAARLPSGNGAARGVAPVDLLDV